MRRTALRDSLPPAVLVAGAWLLIRLGSPSWLRIDWGDPVGWLARAEPDVALAALARMAALALVGWVGFSSLVYLVARLAGIRPGSIRWLSIGPIRRMVDTLLAGWLVLATVTACPPAGAAPAERTTPAETVLPEYIPFPTGEVYPLPDSAQTHPTTTGGPVPVPGLAAGDVPEALDGPPDRLTMVVVRPHDNLWRLAARHLKDVGREAGSAAEVAAYWRRVVEANRPRIRSGDPDLIYPGEEIVLPPVSPKS